jgi:hypothetical protein
VSIDFVVWHTRARLSDAEAQALYAALCEGDTSGVEHHSGIDLFCASIQARYPTIPIERSAGHAIVTCRAGTKQVDAIEAFIWELAHTHSLAIFDPQTGYISYPIAGGGFTRPRPGTTLGSTLLGLLLAAFLLFLGARGGWWVYTDTKLILDGKSWIPTVAEVEASSLTPSGEPHIEYRFLIAGREFRGDRLEIPSRRPSSRDQARRQISDYRPGERITVFYDSTDPSQSVIRQPTMNYFFTFGLGGFALAFGATGVLLLIRMLKPKRQETLS